MDEKRLGSEIKDRIPHNREPSSKAERCYGYRRDSTSEREKRALSVTRNPGRK